MVKKIVLLPGLHGSGVLFEPFIKTLPNNVESLVIAYPDDEKLSYQALVEYVMERLPDEKFMLLAESFSGPIAYQIALRQPTNLDSVVFVATFLENPNPFFLSISKLLPRNFLLARAIPNPVARKFLFDLDASEQTIKCLQKAMQKIAPDVLDFRLQEIAKLTEPDLPATVKAIYIQASNDRLVAKKCIRSFEKFFKNLRVYQVNGPHFILQTKPVDCVKIIFG